MISAEVLVLSGCAQVHFKQALHYLLGPGKMNLLFRFGLLFILVFQVVEATLIWDSHE